MGSGWGQIDSVRASCERCGKPATIVVVTQRTVSVIDLANRQRRPEVTGTATSRQFCKACAAPTLFAESEGVRDVIEGRADAVVARVTP